MCLEQRKRQLLTMGIMLVLFGGWGIVSPNGSALAQEKATPVSGCCDNGERTCCCAARDASFSQWIGSLLLALIEGSQDDKKASPAAKAKGDAARKAIEEHRKALANEGVHACCLKVACVFCATAEDGCPCAKALTKGDPVCPECWGGWQTGYGRLQGVDPKKVKIAPMDILKKMYDAKAKSMEKAGGGTPPGGSRRDPSPSNP